jgi:multidrug efflux pump subunit AcrA (membrane-fusion protein)
MAKLKRYQENYDRIRLFLAEFSWLQTPLLVRTPRIIRRSSRFLWLLALAWAFIMLFVPWQQTSSGTGRVIAYSPTDRQQYIDAPVDGRLGRWFVFEGSDVEAGDPIVELRDNDPDLLHRLNEEKKTIEARFEAATLAKETAHINLQRQLSLSNQGLSSRRNYELAKIEYAKYVTDEARAKSELIQVQTKLARQNSQLVRAPREGTILRRQAGEHSVLVKAGESIAILVPKTESRAVELWIDGNDIALVRVGQTARLQFSGWPAIQFSGWPSVAVGTFSGKVSVIDAADSGDGKFRILIVPQDSEPWPPGQYLRQGVRVQGWLLLGEVTVGFELWRRFNGFPPTTIHHEDLKLDGLGGSRPKL